MVAFDGEDSRCGLLLACAVDVDIKWESWKAVLGGQRVCEIDEVRVVFEEGADEEVVV